MAKAGDKFTTTLKLAHARWGTHRHTNTRTKRSKEGYLHIPAYIARSLDITNSNAVNKSPIYNVSTADGFIKINPYLPRALARKATNLQSNSMGKEI